MPDTIAEQLAHQQGGVIPARVPGTEHPADEHAGDPRPLRPATITLSRISGPAISATAFPGRPAPVNHRARQAGCTECTLDSAAHVKPEHATGAARPWPSVESRRCTPTVLAARRRPLYVRGHRDTAARSATR